MSKLILSAFADEYSSNFDEQLAVLNELGISHIELRFVDGKNVSALSDEEIDAVEEKLHKANIRVSSIGSPLGKIKLDEDMDAHMQMAEKLCALAKRLNAKFMRVFSFYLPDGKTRAECRDEVLAALERLLDIADKYGVTLCHENEANIYAESPDYCLDVLQHFKGRLKAVFDMGNFALDGYEPYPNAYQMLRPYIAYFHVKDALSAGAIVPPGKGEGKIQKIFDAYKQTMTADTFVTLEPHLQTFSGLNALASKDFDNPYKFESQEIAFKIAFEELCKLV